MNFTQNDILNHLWTTSKDLQSYYSSFLASGPQPTIQKLLSLANELTPLLRSDPALHKLTQLLFDLKKFYDELESSHGYSFISFLRRQRIYYKVSCMGLDIDREIQSYVDKEAVLELVTALQDPSSNEVDDEDGKLRLLIDFQQRLARGFDRNYQDLILTARVFNLIESTLCEPRHSTRVREHAGHAIVSLVRFNRNVFVGLVLMGSSIATLVSIQTYHSIKAVASLVSLIKSPLIDEMESHGEITRIIELLRHGDKDVQVAAFHCVCEVQYYGRKEVIEGIIEAEVVELLVEMQRLNYSLARGDDEDPDEEERTVFAGCVARFAVQVEVGEGMNGKEKGEFKLEVLRRVKEACADDAVASATICSDILWGSSP